MFKSIIIISGIVVGILGILAAIVIVKPYTEKIDTIALYTGGNGSGKSFFSCHRAIVELIKLRFEVFLKNINPVRRLIQKKPKIPKPILISSIPVRVSLFEMSTPLTFNPLVLQSRLPQKCVVFIDEVNLFLSQMDYRLESEEQLNEAITLFRHSTLGGKLILNTQNVNKIHYIFRYCANRSYNLCEFRKPILGLPILAWVKCRNVSIADDIKTVEEKDVNEGRRNLFCFFPFFRWYDTYCYSDRYNNLPYYQNKPYTKMKRNSLMKLDIKQKFPNLLDITEEFEDNGGVGSECSQPSQQENKDKQPKPSFSYSTRRGA